MKNKVKFFMLNSYYYWAMIGEMEKLNPGYSLDGYHDAKSVYNAGDEL